MTTASADGSDSASPVTPEDLKAAEELAQGDGMYYVSQERAFAPGISGEWPAVIKPPKVPNARLVKRDGAWVGRLLSSLRAVERERDQALADVETAKHDLWQYREDAGRWAESVAAARREALEDAARLCEAV